MRHKHLSVTLDHVLIVQQGSGCLLDSPSKQAFLLAHHRRVPYPTAPFPSNRLHTPATMETMDKS